MLEKILEQIPFEKLEKGKWYVGRGRNSNVAYFDGENFITITHTVKFKRKDGKILAENGEHQVKIEGYYTEKDGCFQPFLSIDEGKPLDTIDGKYCEKLQF